MYKKYIFHYTQPHSHISITVFLLYRIMTAYLQNMQS